MTTTDDLVDALDLIVPGHAGRNDSRPPHIQGSLPRELHVLYERDLLPSDIEALKLPRGGPAKSLVRIHASHHSLARCLAAGMRPAQASLVTGYSASRISILQNDPSFTALVEDYRLEVKGIFADMAERMSNISMDALELMQDKMHDAPEALTIPMLLDIVRAFADRTGFGPGQEVHLKVDRDFIDRPPRETAEEWSARRARELSTEGTVTHLSLVSSDPTKPEGDRHG